MKQLSRELLESTIADWEKARDEIPFGLGEEGDNTLAALRFALAGMEQEPVCYLTWHQGCRAPDSWIPCSERMPELVTNVLVTDCWLHYSVAFWDGTSWVGVSDEPTHWQPLPAPPKDGV